MLKEIGPQSNAGQFDGERFASSNTMEQKWREITFAVFCGGSKEIVLWLKVGH